MLESALDAVVSMSHDGRVIEWNHAAETIFGYSADETIGRDMAADMAELIVPPALRSGHRNGLARFLLTNEGVALNQRLELTGMRKDGTQFPVELTITRISVPGPPTFTGYLRDITERKRSESELRASRARLVEIAHAERRRIQRNLHDGAQQRLTAVLLNLTRLRDAPSDSNELLARSIDELAGGLQDLRELANGLHPALLTERGLSAALEALALRAPIPVEVRQIPADRLADGVEAAAYYVVAESLANVQKHARASEAVVSAAIENGALVVEVRDDGVGGAHANGSGLRGLADRVEAIGGRLELASPSGAGTRVVARIPLA
jgi:PAS domain S-box-containing protein